MRPPISAFQHFRFLLFPSGSLLLAAALERFMVAASNSQMLTFPEPALGIPVRYAVPAVGVLELTVALICLFGTRPGVQLGWLICLSFDLASYRVCLHYLHINPAASCIGALTDPLHLTHSVLAPVLPIIPICLLVAGSAAAVSLWLSRRKSAYLKTSCPSCGTHIEFQASRLGEKTTCPHCQTTITLRRPEILKMSCFFCQGHIEFPAHAIGNKLQCPHCKKGITLKELATP
jgi:hypothetical protein